ncbi:AF1514 family protein [Desulfococcaceae bacterium HSG8]|nr:AF1514 family protein [Desulfococcaceae bacterium HSG8]
MNIRNYLKNPVDIKIVDKNIDFDGAKEIAKAKAKTFCSEPMLLAWYQGKTGEYLPKAECGRTDKPVWIVYAESRDADITININDEEYVFIYKAMDRSGRRIIVK